MLFVRLCACENVAPITHVVDGEKVWFMCVVYVSELMGISVCSCDKKEVLFYHVIVD